VNNRLEAFLAAQGFEVLALAGFGLLGFRRPGSERSGHHRAPQGLHRGAVGRGPADFLRGPAHGVAQPLEARHGVPVVASTQAAFWAALRLVGEASRAAAAEETATALAICAKVRACTPLRGQCLEPGSRTPCGNAIANPSGHQNYGC
jgi:hypothetical protein